MKKISWASKNAVTMWFHIEGGNKWRAHGTFNLFFLTWIWHSISPNGQHWKVAGKIPTPKTKSPLAKSFKANVVNIILGWGRIDFDAYEFLLRMIRNNVLKNIIANVDATIISPSMDDKIED